MALINCSECSKEISDKAVSCPHCGYKNQHIETAVEAYELTTPVSSISKKAVNRKTIAITGISIIIVIATIIGCFLVTSSGVGSLEKEARGYYKQLKKADSISTLDAVICLTKKYYGEDHVARGYLFVYNGSQFAYFDNGEYKGNGYNGGEATGDTKSFYNIHSLNAQKVYMEYLLDGSHLITFEDIKNDEIGLLPLNENKVK